MIVQGQPDPYSVMPNPARFPFTKNHLSRLPRTRALTTGCIPCKQNGILNTRIKKDLVPDAEVPAAEMMFREELAGRAETTYLFHRRGRRSSASAEKFCRLVFFKRMTLVVLAYRAVLPADLPVLLVFSTTGLSEVNILL